MSKAKSIILNCIIVLLCLIAGILILYDINLFCGHTLKPKYCEYDYFLLNTYQHEQLRESEYIDLLEQEFGVSYPVIFTNLPQNIGGKASPMLKLVFIDKNLTSIDFEISLAHEFTHIRYQTVNECFTTYQTIIDLYESDSEYLKAVAIEYANDVMFGRFPEQYNCGYYLYEYFTNLEGV